MQFSDIPLRPEWIARIQITPARLKFVSGAAPADKAAAYAPLLDQVRRDGDIQTPLRVAHWIAQIMEETRSLQSLEEGLNYSAERIAAVWPRLASRAAELAHKPQVLANAAYADWIDARGRLRSLGNGDEASGDGYRYRGRGFLQLTGRTNYKLLSAATKLDLEGNPDLAQDPATAARIAALYWQRAHCNLYADRDDVRSVTIAVNGTGTQGLDTRTLFALKGKTVWK